MFSLSYTTLDGNNTYAFTDRPVLSNFNTTSALFAALDSIYQTNLINYLETTLRSSFTLSTEAFNTVLSAEYVLRRNGPRLASPRTRREHRRQLYSPEECQQVSIGASVNRIGHPLHLFPSRTRNNRVLCDVVI